MQIQINSDHNITGDERLSTYVSSTVEKSLDRFSKRITRMEIHFSDENGKKGGANDKRCMLEARISNHAPTSVTHHAPTVKQALVGAISKLEKSLQHTFERLDHRH